MIEKSFIVLICLFSCIYAVAQRNELRIISNDGASANYFYSAVAEDAHGYIWVGTENNGVFKIVGHNFVNYKHSPDSEFSITSGFIHSIKKDEKNRLWIGARTGLSLIIPENDSIINVNFNLKKISPYCPRVYTHMMDGNGGYWVGSGCGLLHVDSTFQVIAQFVPKIHFEGSGYDERVIYAIHKDWEDPNILWIGTRWGLKSFNVQNREFTVHPNPRKWHNHFPDVQQYGYFDIVQVKSGELWLPTLFSGGILRYNTVTKLWNQYLFPKSDKDNPTSGNMMHSLESLNDTTLLFGNNIGYGVFNINSTSYEPFNNVNYGSDQGYFRQFLDSRKLVWVAGISGLRRSEKSILDHTIPPKQPKIQYLKSNGLSRTVQDLNVDTKIHIDSNDIEINFYSVNFPFLTGQNKRAKLKGFRNEWIYLRVDENFVVNNLPAGSYQFSYEVRESEHADLWIAGQDMYIRVFRPYYQSIYFIIFCLLIIVALVYFLVHRRIAKIRKRHREKVNLERQLAEVKMSALSSQMNPHFLFNTMNSINHYILKNESERASHYLTRFSRLIRQVLHNSQKKLITLDEEMNAMKLYIEMEQLRFDDGFLFELSVSNDIDLEHTRIPPMIIQPYIENAIWHGLMPQSGLRKLIINIEKEAKHLYISIRDNGIGRKAARDFNTPYREKSKSVGMSITQNRIQLANQLYQIKADVEVIDLVEEGRALGTEVVISIPFLSEENETYH